MFRADTIDAAEAYRIGLVDAVVGADELAGYVADEVALYASRGPLSLAMTKRAVTTVCRWICVRGWRSRPKSWAFATDDKEEGMRAFLEKRAPHFRGQ